MRAWPSRFPHPALVFVVLAWGLNFSVIKIAYLEISPAAVGLARYLLMLPLLVVWCLVIGEDLKYAPGTFWKTNVAGFFGSGAYMVLFLEGMRNAPPALAALALATAPIITTMLSVALRQDKFTWNLLFGSIVAFGGVAFSVMDKDNRSNDAVMGTLLIVCSAVLWSVSIILYRPLLKGVSAVKVLTLSFPGAMVAMVPYGAYAVATTRWNEVSSKGWLAMGYLVLVAGVGAFAAYYKGLSDVGPARTSMTQYFVPPVAALFAAVVLHDRLTVNEVVGLVVVILGVGWTSTNRRPPVAPRD